MEYTDNPRKIYGCVEIVYSDADISKDIRIVESGNSKISHPDEVHKETSSPTVKACTMDGNAMMDGSFQMIDDTCVCGWWSKAIADTHGAFNSPFPFIELSFVQRPIISWIIKGDDKLNQYPVDFVIEYKCGGKTLLTELITENSKCELKLEPKLSDIDAIRMTIQKWNMPNACAKILQFYDKLYERYEGDAVQTFEVNEEIGSEDTNFNINSDTASVILYNADRKFDCGYLRSLLLLDRKITFSIGIEKNGLIEYDILGQFYSDEWQVSQDSQWVKCQAVDKLIRLQDKDYIGFPLTEQVSLKEITKDIFDKLGYASVDYSISENLANFIVPNAYLPKMSVWDALQEIANAGLCYIYVDRDDRIIVRSHFDEHKENGISINASNMFSSNSNITLTKFANQVEVEYTEVTLSDDIVDSAETQITLAPKEIISLNIGYTVDIANAWVESDNANIQVTSFNSGIDFCEVMLVNIDENYQTAKLKVTGNAIVENRRCIILKDEDSIRNYGITTYKHPASDLVQTAEQANLIASVLIKNMRAGEGIICTEWRGNPVLGLNEEYKYRDRFGDEKELVCEYNQFIYDGAFKQETRGRKKNY